MSAKLFTSAALAKGELDCTKTSRSIDEHKIVEGLAVFAREFNLRPEVLAKIESVVLNCASPSKSEPAYSLGDECFGTRSDRSAALTCSDPAYAFAETDIRDKTEKAKGSTRSNRKGNDSVAAAAECVKTTQKNAGSHTYRLTEGKEPFSEEAFDKIRDRFRELWKAAENADRKASDALGLSALPRPEEVLQYYQVAIGRFDFVPSRAVRDIFTMSAAIDRLHKPLLRKLWDNVLSWARTSSGRPKDGAQGEPSIQAESQASGHPVAGRALSNKSENDLRTYTYRITEGNEPFSQESFDLVRVRFRELWKVACSNDRKAANALGLSGLPLPDEVLKYYQVAIGRFDFVPSRAIRDIFAMRAIIDKEQRPVLARFWDKIQSHGKTLFMSSTVPGGE